MSNIKVAVRVRPLNRKEEDEGSTSIIQVQDNTISIANAKVFGVPDFGDSRDRIKHFTFDCCYDCMSARNSPGYASQAQVFQDLGTDVLQAAFDGFNACVFAYGQTGTGKTHTMMGPSDDVGLIPRICEGLFSHVADCADEKVSCRIDISYFEIYNERVRDLLQPEQHKLNEKYSLKVREHPKDGPFVQDLSWHRVKENIEIQELLERGNEHRVTAETYMHDHSSRSHAIVTISFTQARLEENLPSEIVSKIHLVDLAGSERADPNSSTDFRRRLTEGANINKSLVTLGYVIKALAERSLLSWSTDDMGSLQNFSSSAGGETIATQSPPGPNKQKIPYIPYRDSVLTWLLKDSLGGNSKTIMVATVTPASRYYSESVSTLRYAQRAKNIVNKPRINEDSNVALIRELRKEIVRLQGMLANAQMPQGVSDTMFLIPIIKKYDPDCSDDQSGTLVSVPDSDSLIAEKLQENEAMAKQLTQSWMCKWSSTHDIMKESDLSIRGLRNRSSSMGVMIDSQLPYLMGMEDDVLSTGIFIFHLKEGDTLVGREDADREQDIVLHGPTIEKEHCIIRNTAGVVTLHPCLNAHCTVQGQECMQPTRLTQGDYVVIGGNQVFRFNNPTEAAKLREHRRSQGSLNTLNVSVHSFGGLSRASSYSSIGGEDPNYLSPYSQLMRSYPNMELEQKHQTEQERIEDARKNLEQLRAEYERAEDARQEMEERMYELHEQHQQEIEDQRQQLHRVMEENHRARGKAEEELDLARESLAKEREAFQRQLDEERRRLKQIKEGEELAVQTDSVQTASVSADTDCIFSLPHSADTPGTQGKAQGRRMSADDQLKELDQVEFVRKMSHRETEQSLSIQQEDIEDQYNVTQEQIENKVKLIKTIEEQYQREDAQHLQEVSDQVEKLKELQRKEAQLAVYIVEKEELMNLVNEQPNPLRSASSEMYLTDDSLLSTDFPQRTTSLQDIPAGLEISAPLGIKTLDSKSTSNSESMDTGSCPSLQPMDTCGTTVDRTSDKDSKDVTSKQKLTSAAKDVTSRLYKPLEPKFKYVPKTKEKPVVKSGPRSRPVRDKGDMLRDSSSPSPLRDRTSPSPLRERTSPSPLRSKVGPGAGRDKKSPSHLSDSQTGRNPRPSPPRDAREPKLIPSGMGQGVSNNPKLIPSGKSPTKKGPSVPKGPSTTSGSKQTTVMAVRHKELTEPDDHDSPESLRQKVNKSPDRLSAKGNGSARLASAKIRQMKSASSLASVPEAAGEGEESMPLERSMSSEPGQYGPVKRRARKGRSGWDDEDLRRHSAPEGEELAEALDRYAEEIDPGFRKSVGHTDDLISPVSQAVTINTDQGPHVVPTDTGTTSLDRENQKRHNRDDLEHSECMKSASKRVLPGELVSNKNVEPAVPLKKTKSNKQESKEEIDKDTEETEDQAMFSDDSLDSDNNLGSSESPSKTSSVKPEDIVPFSQTSFHINEEQVLDRAVMSDDSLEDSVEELQSREESKDEQIKDEITNTEGPDFSVPGTHVGEKDGLVYNLGVVKNDNLEVCASPPVSLPEVPNVQNDEQEIINITDKFVCGNDNITQGENLSQDITCKAEGGDGSETIHSVTIPSTVLPGSLRDDASRGSVHFGESNTVLPVECDAQTDYTEAPYTGVILDPILECSSEVDHDIQKQDCKMGISSMDDKPENSFMLESDGPNNYDLDRDQGRGQLDKVLLWSEGTSDTDISDSPVHKPQEQEQHLDLDNRKMVADETTEQTIPAHIDDGDGINFEQENQELSAEHISDMEYSDTDEERFVTEVVIREPPEPEASEGDTIVMELDQDKPNDVTTVSGESEEIILPQINIDSQIDKNLEEHAEGKGQDGDQNEGKEESRDFAFEEELSPLQRKEIYHSSLDVTLDPDTNSPFEEQLVTGGETTILSVTQEPLLTEPKDLVIKIHETEPIQDCPVLESIDSENLRPCVGLGLDGSENVVVEKLEGEGDRIMAGETAEIQNLTAQSGDGQKLIEDKSPPQPPSVGEAVMEQDTERLTIEDSKESIDLGSTNKGQKPRTRTLGVGTGPDLLGEVQGAGADDGHSQCSNDSFLDPQDELQVLQEALEQLPAKPVTTAGPQLSTARRAARQRVMNQRKQRGADSDGVSQLSDESPASAGNRSKSSSRPDSGSRRRRRVPNKNSQRFRDHSSEEYASSDNDSSYSNDSLVFDETQNGDVKETHDSIFVNGQASAVLEGGFVCDKEADMPGNRGTELRNRQSPRKFQYKSDTSDTSSDGRRSVGVQTADRQNRIRSAGSTYTDVSEDFNFSMCSGDNYSMGRNMVMSPLSLWNSNDSDSPSDRHSIASGGVLKSLSDPDKTLDRAATPNAGFTPRSSTSSMSRLSSNLDRGPTEVWSSSASELRSLPSFSDHNSYVMETETVAPGQSSLDYSEDAQSVRSFLSRDAGPTRVFVVPSSSTPRPTHGRRLETSTPTPQVQRQEGNGQTLIDEMLDQDSPGKTSQIVSVVFPESQLSPGQIIDENTPVKFEVTIHEDNTSIQYNVEKTEYKTYSLRSPSDTTELSAIPDTIHVNMRESVVKQSQEVYESHHEEEVSFHRPEETSADDSYLVLERSFRSSCSSEREYAIENGEVNKDTEKQIKVDQEGSGSYILPSYQQSSHTKANQRKGPPHLEASGVVGTTSYDPSSEASEHFEGAVGDYPEMTPVDRFMAADESDTTSDYGTITSIDGRRGCISFTSDSDEGDLVMSPPGISPRASHVSVRTGTREYPPASMQDWTNQNRTSHEPLEDRTLEVRQQDTGIIPEEGQALCSVESVTTPTVIAGRTAQSSPLQLVSLAVSDTLQIQCPSNLSTDLGVKHQEELVTDVNVALESQESASVELQQKAEGIEEDLDTDSSSVDTVKRLIPGQTHIPSASQETLESVDSPRNDNIKQLEEVTRDEVELPTPTGDSVHLSAETECVAVREVHPDVFSSPSYSPKSPAKRSSQSSVDDIYLSLERLDSSCSSEYRTPRQSPREDIDTASPQVVDVAIPDLQDESPTETPREAVPEPKYSPQSPNKSASTVRTVSVNTESVPTAFSQMPAIANVRRTLGSTTDPVQTEAIRRELEQKIARLKHLDRSLSDSAISSDYTDGDSSSVSPRASRLYDTDKALMERRLRCPDDNASRAYRVSYSPTRVQRTIDFEASAVNKSPFNDSGNVFDHEDMHSKHQLGDESEELKEAKEHISPQQTEGIESSTSAEIQRNMNKLISGKQFVPVSRCVGKFPETLIDALLAIKPYPVQRSASLDSISTLVNMGTQLSRAVRDFQSSEDVGSVPSEAVADETVAPKDQPGEAQEHRLGDKTELSAGTLFDSDPQNSISVDSNQNVASNVDDEETEETDPDQEVDVFELSLTSTSSSGTDSQLHRSLSPGEVVSEADSFEDGRVTVESQGEMESSLANIHPEKSTSMSVLEGSQEKEVCRRLSEGNIDDYDSHNTSCSSNDSITFVFVGKRPDDDEEERPVYDEGDVEGAELEYTEQMMYLEKGDSESENEEEKEYRASGRGSVEYIEPEYSSMENVQTESGSGEYRESESSSALEHRLSVEPTTDSVEYEDRENESPVAQQYTEFGLSNLPSDEALHSALDNEVCEINRPYIAISVEDESESLSVEKDTSDGLDQGYHDDDEDSAPLRHRFGIDESVLPIPERSVSADNLPKQVLNVKDLHRSRSASMLDVGKVEDPASEEGIFPPALTYVDEDDTQLLSGRTMSDGNLDQVSQRTLSGLGVASYSNRTSSDIETQSTTSDSSSISDEEGRSVYSRSQSDEEFREEIVVEYTELPQEAIETEDGPEISAPSSPSDGEIDPEFLQNEEHFREVLKTVEKFIKPGPLLVDRGMSTGSEGASRFVSRGMQASLADSGTQTSNDMLTENLHPDQAVLPALSAPFRAQSMDSIGLGSLGESRMVFPEGSDSWHTLGHLMVETTQLLRRINEQLPGLERRGSVTSSEESHAILQQWREISVQTGRSLHNLETVGLQTEEDISEFAMHIREETPVTCASFTQVDKEFRLEPLAVSETVTSELMAGPSETIACDICIQTDEATSKVAVCETIEMSVHAGDQAENSAVIREDKIQPDQQAEDRKADPNVNYKREIIYTLPSLAQPENYPNARYEMPEVHSQNDNGSANISKDTESAEGTESGPNRAVTYEEEIVSVLPSLIQHENYPATEYVLPVFQYPENEEPERESHVPEESKEATTSEIDGRVSVEESPFSIEGDYTDSKCPVNELNLQPSEAMSQEKEPTSSDGMGPPSDLEALRQEHAKLMAYLQKASETRKTRKDIIQARKQIPEVEHSVEKQPLSASDAESERFESRPVWEEPYAHQKVRPTDVTSGGDNHVKMNESSQQNAEHADSSVCSSESNRTVTSPQEMVQISIQVDPSAGLTVENTTYKSNTLDRDTSTYTKSNQQAVDGPMLEHTWQMSGSGVTSVLGENHGKDIEKMDNAALQAPESTTRRHDQQFIKKQRTPSGTSITSEETTDSVEVAEVMAANLKGPSENGTTRTGAHNPRIMQEAHVVEDILSDDDTISDDQAGKSPLPIMENMIKTRASPREIPDPSILKPLARDSRLPREFLLLKNVPERSQQIFLPEDETIVPRVYRKDRADPQDDVQPEENFPMPLVEEDLIILEQKNRSEKYPSKDYSTVTDYAEPYGRNQFIPNAAVLMDNERDVIIEDDRILRRPGRVTVLNTGVGHTDDFTQATVDISDDFTQTDIDIVGDTVLNKDMATLQRMPKDGSHPEDSHKNITQELERLQNERSQILELLSLNYLPTSLTVELLEAKLNYCIGQTDLLLDTLDDNFQPEDSTISSFSEQQFARDFINKYRSDLKQSKRDIQICRERLNRNKGLGRGRTKSKKSDLLKFRRQADIEAFKLERQREQQDYERSRSGTPLKGNSPQVTPRSNRSRSTSPASFTPSYMTPKQHKDHLVTLRKQLVRSVKEEEKHHRSCSPRLNHYRLPLSHHDPSNLTFSPKISVSMTDMSDSSDTDDIRAYSVPPGTGNGPSGSRTVSLDRLPYPGAYSDPSLRSTVMAGRRIPHHSSLDTKVTAESIFSPQESEQILREIEEIRHRTQMSAPVEEMLRRASFSSDTHSHRSPDSSVGISPRPPRLPQQHDNTANEQPNVTLSLTLDSSTADSYRGDGGLRHVEDYIERPYSPYSAYAREHVVPNDRPGSGGVLRGSYELYDRCSLDQSETSSVMSFESDARYDSGHRHQQHHLDDETMKRLRPVQSSDIRAKLGRHKR